MLFKLFYSNIIQKSPFNLKTIPFIYFMRINTLFMEIECIPPLIDFSFLHQTLEKLKLIVII